MRKGSRGCGFKNLSSDKRKCVGVNAGTLPVTCSDAAAAAPQRAVGRVWHDDALAADAFEDTLACERCERDSAEPELGLAGRRGRCSSVR